MKRHSRYQPSTEELADMTDLALVKHAFREARLLDQQKQSAVSRLLNELAWRIR